ncbi:dirigent protein 4-like [Rosa rugosa]|uniref:dirigent protein 4-like n=1 Tax=Rosa rugosa TaxID=74645 RepID=UPI002B40CB2F|nr:dirigent protein 4-like [Rosa rugosa]
MMKCSGLVLGLLALLLLAMATKPAHCKYYSKTIPNIHRKEKVTHLHFYYFDILSGTKPSAVEIARPSLTRNDTSPTPFGSLTATDDPLREGPETNSTVIGNARGIYLSASQYASQMTLMMYKDFGFTAGKFKGSSFGVFSRNPIWETTPREVALVGGRGKFRLARGFAKLRTHYLNVSNGDAVVEYRVTLIHY